ncbi:calcium-binding protein [Streptomyces sp. B6B3]|uniref:calcium-binding protein n=1 Tax=Streptomyces sp. B6B3 TaxID=3153570 RepID=UPI00325D7112
MRRSIVVLGALTLAGAGLAAPSASAEEKGTAWVYPGGDYVYYYANDGEANDVVVLQGPNGPTEFIIDDIVPIVAGNGCVHPDAADPTYVVCTITTPEEDLYTYVYVELWDLDDELVLRAGDESYSGGGDGNDVIDGGDGEHFLSGGSGDDVIRDATVAYGGPGDDIITSDSAAQGGDGNDTIHARLGSAEGGAGDDLLLGGDGANHLFGEAGADEIRGGRGNDELNGGEDDDTVYGNSGDDILYGGPGDDLLSGGPGADEVHQD